MTLTAEQTIRLEIVSLLLAAGEDPASAAAAAPSLIRLVMDGPDDPLSDLRPALEDALAEARDAKQRYESAIAALPAVKPTAVDFAEIMARHPGRWVRVGGHGGELIIIDCEQGALSDEIRLALVDAIRATTPPSKKD